MVVDPSPLSLMALAGVFHWQGHACTCARTAQAAEEAFAASAHDLIVWDVADDAASALEGLERIRRLEGLQNLPAIALAEARWAGLEKQTEKLATPTRCLFKPIDPGSLTAVAEQLLWMPALISSHRRRGSTPNRPGWVTL